MAKLYVLCLSATDVPSMDPNGLSDPYCRFWLSNAQKKMVKTRYIDKTLTPVWNETFTFDVAGCPRDTTLHINLKDKNTFTTQDISHIDFPFNTLPVGAVIDQELTLNPVKNVKKGGRVKLRFHLAAAGATPFVDTTVKPKAAPPPRQTTPPSASASAPAPTPSTGQTARVEPAQSAPLPSAAEAPAPEKKKKKHKHHTERASDTPPESTAVSSSSSLTAEPQPEPEPQPAAVSTSSSAPAPVPPPIAEPEPEPDPEVEPEVVVEREVVLVEEVEVPPKPEDYTIVLMTFLNDELHLEGGGAEVAKDLEDLLKKQDYNVIGVPITSAIAACTMAFAALTPNPKSLVIQILSNDSMKKMKVVCEAFNDAHFVIPDLGGAQPLNEKVIRELEHEAILTNPLHPESFLKGIELSRGYDFDRFIANYFYAVGIHQVGTLIGGCLRVETPGFEFVAKVTQVAQLVRLIETTIAQPCFR
jgi:hypothetical protein